MVRKPAVSNEIPLVVCMLAAVDLNDEAALATNEVYDVGPDWLLTNELEAPD
jgi:hypothetical protein